MSKKIIRTALIIPVILLAAACIVLSLITLELRNTDGGSNAESSKIFICEHEGRGIQPGVRYCSIRELREQFGKMTPAEDSIPYRARSLPLDIFIMTPGDIAVTHPTYELTVTYSWLGIFRHTATATIK